MSLENKLKVAAAMAAGDAMAQERGRILWIIEQRERELVQAFESTILIEARRHAAEVKLTIARALFQQLRIDIASGVRKCNSCDAPVIKRLTCERCMLTKRSNNGDEGTDPRGD